MEPTPSQRGLDNNPGKDGHTFNDTHPYFPKDCNSCPFNKGLTNKVQTLFSNQKKHCNSCSKVDKALPNQESSLKLTAQEKHNVYSRPIEQQFENVAQNVQRHILKGTDEEDYERILKAAILYGKSNRVLIMPEIHAKETEIRKILGVPNATKIPDLKVANGWVDVKSPKNYRNIMRNAHQASEQGAIACITDDRIEIDENVLLRLSGKDIGERVLSAT